MRREFEYWYPLDLRVSGKDLIPNHLTFFLYIHLAIFTPEYWPRGVRANGHLMLNGEKMSKSTGNFMTLNELIQKYGADASRIALADAGDGVNDANFEEDVADNNILRLYTLREWCEEVCKDSELRTGDLNDFQDALFNNELNALVTETKQHYEDTNYKLALKAGLYEFVNARDFYREACTAAGIKMHKGLVLRYIELQANTSSNINSAEGTQLKKKAKGKETGFDPKKPKKLTIFVTNKFPAWQEKYIDLLRTMWDPATNSVNDKELNGQIAKMGEMKKAMPFVQNLKKRLQTGEKPDVVLNRKLAFDEKDILVKMVPGLKKTAGLRELDLIEMTEGSKTGKSLLDGSAKENLAQSADGSVPGNPTFHFDNVAE